MLNRALCLSGLLAVAVATAYAGDAVEIKAAPGQPNIKLCSVIHPGNWRDSFQVPKDFAKQGCADYGKHVAAQQYQLGCIWNEGVSLGDVGGANPVPNCGW